MLKNKIKILIADDEVGMRSGIERVLCDYKVPITEANEEIQFIFQTAESGQEVLEKITSSNPDILLLDYKLQDINGLDILKSLKEQHLDILTIMVTAYASLEIAITATKRGAHDFLAKPFSPQELKTIIQKAVSHLYHKRKVEQLQKEKHQIRFEFISILTHELKSPLHAVESYLRIMEQHLAGEDLSKYNEMINRSLIRLDGMKRLILDILDLTRLESGKAKRELKSQELNIIAKECIELISPLASERNINLTLTSPEKLHFTADRTEMEMLFNNLLSNAVKYNVEYGAVQIILQQENRQMSICCKDTGIGIKQEEQDRLFNEFVRIKNDKTETIQGSGLGLAILKKIVLLYNGVIKVDSQPGVGSVFTVILPIEQQEAPIIASPE